MSQPPFNFGEDNQPDPEMMRRLLEQIMGQKLPDGMLDNLDLSALQGMPGLPTDPAAMQALAMQMQAMFAEGDGKPVNWTLVRDTARKLILAEGDPTVGPNQTRACEDALRVADMWVQPCTDLATHPATPHAWSRSQWIEGTLNRWSRMFEPIGENMMRAFGDALEGQLGNLPEGVELPFDVKGMMSRLGGSMMGAQFGHGLAMLAKEVLTGSEVGVPLLEPNTSALVVNNVTAFAKDLGIEESEVVHYLAAREAARSHLFNAVPWLAGHLFGAVEAYARNIEIDMSAMEDYVRDIDMTNPEALQLNANGMFAMQKSPAQESALTRLSTALALVEGWVSVVSSDAVRGKLPHVDALEETLRRRRATGGPAERTFSTLCGLELRPRLLREAAAYWRSLTESKGIEGRDAVWGHPDLLPEAEQLSAPAVAGSDAPAAGSPAQPTIRGEATLTTEPSDTTPSGPAASADATDTDTATSTDTSTDDSAAPTLRGHATYVPPAEEAPRRGRHAASTPSDGPSDGTSDGPGEGPADAHKESASAEASASDATAEPTERDGSPSTSTPELPQPLATHLTDVQPEGAAAASSMRLPDPSAVYGDDFDAALAALLRGEGDDSAPREDGKGGILPTDGASDNRDPARDGSGDEPSGDGSGDGRTA
ncbi:zinc-dependent metalloprotease [Micrococcales bacterium 31B]|nr:zinc-dependent metalloprotease [Micrococcales bacterium 31B]